MKIDVLTGALRSAAAAVVRQNHYSRSVPSGKSHFVQVGDVIVVWALPANMHAARVVLGAGAKNGSVWELARMWAPDEHVTPCSQAISRAIKALRRFECPVALVSYADPGYGHSGAVYRAAGWTLHGTTEDQRGWEKGGVFFPRRKFHSGKSFLRKPEIEALGYTQAKRPGKLRFVKLLRPHPVRSTLLD